MRRFCLFLFVLLTASFLFVGCRQRSVQAGQGTYQRDTNINPPGTFPLFKNTVTLLIGVEQSATVENFDTNYQVRQIQEKGNLKINFETYPAGQLMQQLELKVVAGGDDLPDVLWSSGAMSIPRLTKFAEAGMIVPLNAYYENSAYYIPRMQEQFSVDIVKNLTSYDGNIYGLPGITAALNNDYSGNWIMVLEPWLLALNIRMPRTIAEFEAMLIAFRDRDPNGNGLKDEIPLLAERGTAPTNMLRALMNPFIFSQPDFWMLTDGKIDVSYNKPGFREGLRYIKGLYDQGLISPLSFTQDGTQMNSMINPLPSTVGAFARISASNLGANDQRRVDYIIQQPLEGPAGTQSYYAPTLPVTKMIITKNCKTPEAAFVMGDFMCSEDQSVLNRYGIEGVDWKRAASTDVSAYAPLGYGPLLIPITQWGTLQNNYLAQNGPHLTHEKWSNGAVPFGIDVHMSLGRSIKPVVDAASKNSIYGIIRNEREQAVMDEFQSTIIGYVQESFARFVTGDLSIDRDWDNYVAQFNRMGLAEVLSTTQSAWDRMNK
jgi:putative aldouronate transport system substrate-binding protein